MKITRLRLLGFKSFVEPTELLIEPGLTGIVGPNGCGKSNLLEAMRWVMGETSYKTMRGSAMEDVIFAGTQSRPARNMAEVSIYLDNSDRSAPAEYNKTDTIEVVRRIEREAGSAFKINGKDVRARDVRLLFEDAATGARSPALVRQGRIGEIVNAKPEERRRILEDAAGIAGLHSRRHEAELRLNAASSNLERLQDLMGQLTSQRNALKRQARQARRYKEITQQIRESEAASYHLNWSAACAHVQHEEEALQAAVRDVGTLTTSESEALRAHSDAAESLEPLRTEEAARAAALHRLTVERDTLDEEETRMRARQEELEDRRAQLERDLAREKETIEEAKETLARLDEEEKKLGKADAAPAEGEAEARALAEESGKHLADAEAVLARATEEHAALKAKRGQLDQAIREHTDRIARLEAQGAELAQKLKDAEASGSGDFAALRADVARHAEALAAAEAAAAKSESAHAAARQAEAQVREAASLARLQLRQIETETETLAKLLKPAEDARWHAVVQDTRVEPGYERALGAALGDDLDAAAHDEAPARWGASGDASGDPALPEGAEPLSRFVKAPKVLARRLAQIGVVEAGRGKAMQKDLKPGQRLVSKQGDLWRWDGYAAAAEAPTAAAKRLAERNRLDDLDRQTDDVRARAAKAEKALEAAQEKVRTAEAEENGARQARRAAQTALSAARDALSAAEAEAQESSKELGALAEAKTRTAQNLEEARGGIEQAEEDLAGLGDPAGLEDRLEALRAEVDEKRATYTDARAALDSLERETRLRRERLEAIAVERERWARRLAGTEQQIETLEDRLTETATELESFADLPAKIAERRSTLLNEISKAEEARQRAADALAEAGNAVRERETVLREAQAALGQARETRARIEAQLEAARERRAEQVRLIRDHLDCAPEDCLKLAGLEPGAKLPDQAGLDARMAKLKADRERLGGVNLRAEEEVEEISTQLEEMTAEQEDLEQAIARLRQGIANLNREGRKRLLDAFDEVNGHFQKLFKTLFGGGEAELQLIESDDPLEAGLEIVAQPPGKKPQLLTLLSGGEKALTALALIFAVFLTNPSPICVMDEVDAPLDDTNVERFLNLMEEMRRSTETRFLIITHHPMTMARMDRLFGVTMAERGISQLVSVDLETAERFRESA